MKNYNNFKAIIAKNNLGYIGLNDELPWKCSEDLKHFKNMTNNCTLLSGYRTAKTLPKFKDRKVIIDDRYDVIDIANIDWCIGGAKTYEKYCHLFDELHISTINDDTIGDTKFPELKNLNPNCKIYYYNFEVDK